MSDVEYLEIGSLPIDEEAHPLRPSPKPVLRWPDIGQPDDIAMAGLGEALDRGNDPTLYLRVQASQLPASRRAPS